MLRATEVFWSARAFVPDRTVPVSDPDVFRPRLIRDATFLETPAGSRRFPSISSASVSTCVCARSTPPPANGWRGSSKTKRSDSTARRRCWRAREAGFATNTILARAASVPRRAVGAARQKARSLLTPRMAEHLSATMRDGLDALVAVGDERSALAPA